MVELKKYTVCLVSDGFSDYIMESQESSDGEFFKVEDVEPILNNQQQLKAEIFALIRELSGSVPISARDIEILISEVEQKLSAV